MYFDGYVKFFLLDDLVDELANVKFYLPFDGFASPPEFKNVDDYCAYKQGVERFVYGRSKRIERLV